MVAWGDFAARSSWGQVLRAAAGLMLRLDTSSLIDYPQGEEGADVDVIDQALLDQVIVLSPVTVSELLSDPHLSQI
ncbi:MAG: hypothetical protein A4E19_04040 [Nitrospira sp. SG-bin1]|nr:MAG: hypothetical protein A4E19_04040 [Nitrospira sp. SG-bin1]